jgi:hypothetical protein
MPNFLECHTMPERAPISINLDAISHLSPCGDHAADCTTIVLKSGAFFIIAEDYNSVVHAVSDHHVNTAVPPSAERAFIGQGRTAPSRANSK